MTSPYYEAAKSISKVSQKRTYRFFVLGCNDGLFRIAFMVRLHIDLPFAIINCVLQYQHNVFVNRVSVGIFY